MSQTTLSTRPVNSSETVLRDKFAESIAGQSELMDKLGQQLITVELAIPGLYATVLKLVQGDKATLTVNGWHYAAFGCWFLSLLLTLLSLIPRRWRVDPTVLQQDPTQKTDVLGLEDFFHKSAQYKRRLLISACLLFWIGVLSVATNANTTPAATNSSATPSATDTSTGVEHIVQPGEGLLQIAEKYGVEEAAVAAANGITNRKLLRVGQKLIIPGITAQQAAKARGKLHVVQSGENLASIAVQSGVTVDEMVKLNNLTDPNAIYVGQELMVPGQ